MDGDGLDAIVINTSGCGTTVKDYGHMFARTELESDAKRVAEKAMDISELLVSIMTPEHIARSPNMAAMGIAGTDAAQPADSDRRVTVAYHAACSLQHGQQIKTHPKTLLKMAGFGVVEPADSHLCCGSAGTYNLMQPEISAQLKARKVRTLEAKAPDIIAAGNIGCMMQIGSATGIPVVHTVELLDWATGGPKPPALGRSGAEATPVPILR